MKTKKNLWIVFFLNFAVFCLAENFLSEKKIAVFEANLKNAPITYDLWLPSAAQKSFITNLKIYTNTILQEIPKFQSAENLRQKIEYKNLKQAQELLKAQIVVFLSFTKNTSVWNLDCEFVDLETGKKIANATLENISKDSDLASVAIDQIFLQTTQSLGVEFSPSQKWLLQNQNPQDENSLKFETQKIFAETEKNNLEKILEKLDQEILEFSEIPESDFENLKQKKNLEMQKNQIQKKIEVLNFCANKISQKLELENERKKILQETQENLENQQKIEELLNEISQKSKQIQKSNAQKMNFVEKFEFLEAKKSFYLENLGREQEIQNDFFAQMEKTYEAQKKNPQNFSIYKATELDSNGNPMPEAVNRVERQNALLRKNLQTETQEKSDEFLRLQKKSLNMLYSEILRDSKMLEKLTAESSLTILKNGVNFFVGNFDSEKKSWQAKIQMSLGKNFLFDYDFFIPIEIVARAMQNQNFNADENFSFYDLFFKTGDFPIFAEIFWNAHALEIDFPSQYKISVSQIVIKSVLTNSSLLQIPLNFSQDCALEPALDLRKKNENPQTKTEKNSIANDANGENAIDENSQKKSGLELGLNLFPLLDFSDGKIVFYFNGFEISLAPKFLNFQSLQLGASLNMTFNSFEFFPCVFVGFITNRNFFKFCDFFANAGVNFLGFASGVELRIRGGIEIPIKSTSSKRFWGINVFCNVLSPAKIWRETLVDCENHTSWRVNVSFGAFILFEKRK